MCILYFHGIYRLVGVSLKVHRGNNSLACPSPTSHHSSSQEALRRSFLEEGCVCVCVCVCVYSTTQSCLTLCDPMDCSAPGSSVHRIFQAGILEWVAISFSRGSSQSRDGTRVSCISCIGRWILFLWRHLGSPFKRCRQS